MYAWVVGDAFAALIGKRFGKHKIKWKLSDGRKSYEGSLAMFISSFSAVLCVLLVRGHLPGAAYFIIPLLGSATATVVELLSRNGMDTVFCPLSAMAVMAPLMILFGGF